MICHGLFFFTFAKIPRHFMKGDECIMPKIDGAKILGILGAFLGLVATLISGAASDKKMKVEIENEVARQLSNIEENED